MAVAWSHLVCNVAMTLVMLVLLRIVSDRVVGPD